MIVRLLMLTLLVAIVWAFAAPEIPLFPAVICGVFAIVVASLAVLSSYSNLVRVARMLRPALIVALAAPAFCMALQIVPIPIHGLGNPIWETASAALNESLAERLTVDIHSTLQAIVQYNMVVALALITAIVSLDKRRAAQLVYVLVAAATIVSARSIWWHVSGLHRSSPGVPPFPLPNDAVPAALGLLLSVVIIIRAFEKDRRNRRPSGSILGPAAKLSIGLAAMIVCLGAILIHDEANIAVSALVGAGTVLAIFAIRKWFYGIWGTAGVLATAAILLLASFTLVPIRQNTDLTVALSRHSQAATERMLQDVGVAGSGAGAYLALLPVYRDVGATAWDERPTTAAVVAIEMGRPFVYGLLMVAVFGVYVLFRRSLQRSYDYDYAAIGSGAAASLATLVLIDGGILDLGTSLLAAALFGLAFAQSQSNTTSDISYSRSLQPVSGAGDQARVGRPARSPRFVSASIRLALGSVAIVLVAQSAWLLTQQSTLGGSPTDVSRFADRLTQAASRLPSNSPGSKDEQGAGDAIAAALRLSPLRGDLWLELAAISKEYKLTRYDLIALLKLSYYTAPNDLALVPRRLVVALGATSAVGDPELRDLIEHDVEIAVVNRTALRPGVVTAYRSATADGRTFADSLISKFDPSYLETVHAAVGYPGTKLSPTRRVP